MPKAHSITPFPADINREHFASWLSGFVDGEGCFYLGWQRLSTYPRPKASLSISLRADDAKSLELIRSFLGCGRPVQLIKQKQGNTTACYIVNQVGHLTNIVVPHFEKYPLIAKKANDFLVWKEAVAYLYSVAKIPLNKHGIQGTIRKWNQERLAIFDQFIFRLRNRRKLVSGISIQGSSILPSPDIFGFIT